jgi:hypothetical protein
MGGTRRARWLVVVALLLSNGVMTAHTGASPPPEPSTDRPTVVVTVRDDGFHWTDAGVGAAATLATTLLVLGIALALRPDREGHGNP